MKNINKKIVSSILLIALIFSSKSINVLASQNDVFDLQTAINEEIVIQQDKDEIEEIENIKSSVLITEDIYQEEDNKAEQNTAHFHFNQIFRMLMRHPAHLVTIVTKLYYLLKESKRGNQISRKEVIPLV